MKDEYIIISKTAIQKRIEELKNAISKCILPEQQHLKDLFEQELEIKTQTLSQSIPLIPEIEKAFDAGRKLSNKSQLYVPDFYWSKEDYISNLKLDI